MEDVAYRVIAAQQTPDHATIARLRVRHEAALASLFSEVLGLCRESGLVKVGERSMRVAAVGSQPRGGNGSRPGATVSGEQSTSAAGVSEVRP